MTLAWGWSPVGAFDLASSSSARCSYTKCETVGRVNAYLNGEIDKAGHPILTRAD
jgi:hypothetical protein